MSTRCCSRRSLPRKLEGRIDSREQPMMMSPRPSTSDAHLRQPRVDEPPCCQFNTWTDAHGRDLSHGAAETWPKPQVQSSPEPGAPLGSHPLGFWAGLVSRQQAPSQSYPTCRPVALSCRLSMTGWPPSRLVWASFSFFSHQFRSITASF